MLDVVITDVDDDPAFVGLEGLERRELGHEKARGHEVARTLGGAARERLRIRVEVDEERTRGGRTQPVAIRAAQRGARDDEPAGGSGVGEPAPDGIEPGETVVVAEGRPAAIFATFAAGWRSSASRKGTPRRPASAAPTVDFPDAETPITTTSGAGMWSSSHMAPEPCGAVQAAATTASTASP